MLKLIEGFYLGKAEPESGGGGSAPVIEELNVTPTTSAQVITAPSGTDGYNPVNVSAVTSSIDANIISANIVDGITILGVTGSATELNGTTLNVTPTTSAQTITPTSPNNGFTEVDVDAVTSSIDANIQAGNIKSGVSILGVTGNVNALVGQTKSVSQNGIVTPDAGYNGLTSVSVNVPNKLIKSNYWIDTTGDVHNFVDVNDSTKKLSATATSLNLNLHDISWTGLQPILKADLSAITEIPSGYSMERAFDSTFNGINTTNFIEIDLSGLITLSNSKCCYRMCKDCSSLTSIDLSSLTTISGINACQGMFTNTALVNVSLPSLTNISGTGCCNNMFLGCTDLKTALMPKLTTISGSCNNMFYNCTSLETVDLSSLTTLSSSQVCNKMFSSCTSLETIRLPSLTNITSNNVLIRIFENCTALANVYFNGLTTTSFGGYIDAFVYMLNGTGTNVTHTLHFPSNLENTIQGLSDYPLFGGTSGYVLLAFDLPATS